MLYFFVKFRFIIGIYDLLFKNKTETDRMILILTPFDFLDFFLSFVFILTQTCKWSLTIKEFWLFGQKYFSLKNLAHRGLWFVVQKQDWNWWDDAVNKSEFPAVFVAVSFDSKGNWHIGPLCNSKSWIHNVFSRVLDNNVHRMSSKGWKFVKSEGKLVKGVKKGGKFR